MLAILLFFTTFITTKERVYPPKEQKSDFKQDLKDLISNKPWILIAGATVFQLVFIVVRNSTIIYYFKYYILDQKISLFGATYELSYEVLSSSFMLSGTIVTIIGAILTKWFAQKFDKKNTYTFFLLGSAIFSAAIFFVPQDAIILLFLLNLFLSFFFGPVSVLQWALYTDTADYSEWVNKRRATGLIMAASLFSLKLGLTLGGAIVGWLLAYYGFVANQVQNAEAITGIKLLMTIYPAIAGVIGALLMVKYPLNNKMMAKIEEELESRRANELATN
jgi:GPH family glycoside/pentoside/hexuronide:cation symporter